MNEEEVNEQDRFEARFFGTLPEKEEAGFDAELQRDPALRERYELFVLSVRGIRSGAIPANPSRTEILRSQFKAIDQELDANDRVRPLFRPWMSWAAAALVCLSVGGLWWLAVRDTPERLAEEFAIVEPGLPVLMDTSPRAMDAIMNAYKQEDLPLARRLLMQAVEVEPQNDTLQYFMGIVDLREGDPQGSERWFARVPEQSVFAAKARYGSALCALRQNEVQRARDHLELVAVMADTQFAARSRALLDRLNQ